MCRKTGSLISLMFIGVVAAFFSCGNDKDTDPLVIHLVNPVIHQHYIDGVPIPWEATVTSNSRITHIALSLWPEDDSTNLMFNVDYFPNATTFNVDTFYVVDDAAITEYHFRISAEDEGGNFTRNPAEDHVHIND